MRLLYPEWLLVIPLLAVAGWFWRGMGLHKPLRILCVDDNRDTAGDAIE